MLDTWFDHGGTVAHVCRPCVAVAAGLFGNPTFPNHERYAVPTEPEKQGRLSRRGGNLAPRKGVSSFLNPAVGKVGRIEFTISALCVLHTSQDTVQTGLSVG